MPAIRVLTPKVEKAVVLSDFHIPFHDETCLSLSLDLCSRLKPENLFLLGDIIDFYGLSDFLRDPSRLGDLQDELDQVGKILGNFRKAVGRKCRIIYLEGNHDYRLVKYLWKHPEIASLEDLKLSSLLKLDDLFIEHRGYHDPLRWRGLQVEHGDRISGYSCYTARQMLDARGLSGISGHSHRMGLYYRRQEAGVQCWAENGCLCSLKVEYSISPNWQHGFSILHSIGERGDRFHIEQVPVLGGKIYREGQVFEVVRR